MKKVILFFCIFTALAAEASAGSATELTTTLSLQDALTRALRDNPLVRIEQIRTDIAQTILREHQFAYEPNLWARYQTNVRPEHFGETNHVLTGITARAPTGTELEFAIENAYYNNHFFTGGGTSASSRIRITQALLQGFGLTANLVPIRRARIDIDLRQEELAGFTQRLLLDTERAYWNLLLSSEELKIFEHSFELANRLLFEAEARLQTGAIAPIDLAIIRAEVASREKQLFDAQTALKQRILTLGYIINAPELFNFPAIVISDTISLLGEADEIEDHLQAAKKFRPDFRQAELLAQRGELDLIQTKNGILPKLDFFITLQGAEYNETFAVFPSDMARTINMGLTLNFPLTSGQARQRHQRAIYSQEQQNLSISNFSRLIEFEIRSAHLEVLRASQQVETAKIVSALQQQKMEAEAEKLRVGRSTGFALLQAQRDLISANLDEARAKAAYSDALLSLYFRDGTLLQRRGVRWE